MLAVTVEAHNSIVEVIKSQSCGSRSCQSLELLVAVATTRDASGEKNLKVGLAGCTYLFGEF